MFKKFILALSIPAVVACAFALTPSPAQAQGYYPHRMPQPPPPPGYYPRPMPPPPVRGGFVVATRPLLFCTFKNKGPGIFNEFKSFLIYDANTQTLHTRLKAPGTCRSYSGTMVVGGLPPYGPAGSTVTVFQDVAAFSIRYRDPNPLVQFFMKDKYKATWGAIPDGPQGVINAGECKVGKPPGIFEDKDFDFVNCN